MLLMEEFARLAAEHAGDLQARVAEFDIGGKHFAFNTEPALMGVVNLSSDSWYRESVCLSPDAAVARARVLSAQGAHIIDIGAESTLANAVKTEGQLQISKLVPVVRELHGLGILVSVETYNSDVLRTCLDAGANVLNLTGVPMNNEMYHMVADRQAALIICYVQGTNVREVGDFDLNLDPLQTMREFFGREIDRAVSAGVTRIFIDPGLGFYYRNLQDGTLRVRHQIKTFLNTFRLRSLGFPVCHALPHAFEFFREEVRCAEPFFAVLAALGKTDLFRTHEVSRVRAVLETLKCFIAFP
jgi:dihydropteroate synthase